MSSNWQPIHLISAVKIYGKKKTWSGAKRFHDKPINLCREVTNKGIMLGAVYAQLVANYCQHATYAK